MFLVGEGFLTNPSDTFTTHLREGVGAAIHPGGHIMATDASDSARTIRYAG